MSACEGGGHPLGHRRAVSVIWWTGRSDLKIFFMDFNVSLDRKIAVCCCDWLKAIESDSHLWGCLVKTLRKYVRYLCFYEVLAPANLYRSNLGGCGFLKEFFFLL